MKFVLPFKIEQDGVKLDFPSEPYKTSLLHILDGAREKYYSFISIDIQKPYKARTTGKHSQNNYVWKLIQIIAEEMGEDVKYVEEKAKLKAVTKGYPYHITLMGDIEPESMSKINTVECGYLIDTLLEMVAFLGIILPPEMAERDTQSLADLALSEGTK